MTTAHRATWRSARGGDQEDGSFRLHVGTAQVSAKAAPSHRELKTRADATGDDRAKLRELLEKTEQKTDENYDAKSVENPDIRALDDDALLDDDVDTDVPRAAKRYRTDNNDDYSDDDDDDEDDEELLMRELQKIRAERAAQREAEEREKEAVEENVLGANPLLAYDNDDTASIATATTNASVAVKRRWNDDVIFKNQARGTNPSNSNNAQQPRFVNDTVRNDFHRRFLRRYIL